MGRKGGRETEERTEKGPRRMMFIMMVMHNTKTDKYTISPVLLSFKSGWIAVQRRKKYKRKVEAIRSCLDWSKVLFHNPKGLFCIILLWWMWQSWCTTRNSGLFGVRTTKLLICNRLFFYCFIRNKLWWVTFNSYVHVHVQCTWIVRYVTAVNMWRSIEIFSQCIWLRTVVKRKTVKAHRHFSVNQRPNQSPDGWRLRRM